jgi:hypothetical protein
MVNSPAEPPPIDRVLRRLRLAQLQLVRMAGDGANFRDMAQALRVTQPAITKMAHELELTLGARVFERGSGGMRARPSCCSATAGARPHSRAAT